MKKKMKNYDQPTVKVVRFMVEQGFAGSDPSITGEHTEGGDDWGGFWGDGPTPSNNNDKPYFNVQSSFER